MGNVDMICGLSSWLNLTQTLRLSEGSDWHTPSLGGKGDSGKKPLSLQAPVVSAEDKAIETAVVKELATLTKTLFLDEGTEPVISPEEVEEEFTSKIALAHHLRTNRPDLYDRHFPALLEEPPLVRKRYPYLFVSQIRRLHAATADADEQSFYYVPGQGAIKLKWQRPKKGVGRPRSQYDCPNKVCSGVFARIDELAHHLTNGCCIPTRGKLTGMQRDWTESDGELLAIADPPVYQDAQEALKIADRPQMTRYQWPQDSSGIWCLTENAAFNCFNADIGLEHTELDVRWVGENERQFLLDNAVIAKTAPKEFRVYKAAEVHSLMQLGYPEIYARYMKQINDDTAITEDGPGGQFDDDEVGGGHGGKSGVGGHGEDGGGFALGSMTVARQRAFAAIRQAARYNRVLGYERVKERDEYFDPNTQISQIPASKRLRLAHPNGGGGAQRPVAVVAGQFQDGFRRYSSSQELHSTYVSPNGLEGIVNLVTTGYSVAPGGGSRGGGSSSGGGVAGNRVDANGGGGGAASTLTLAQRSGGVADRQKKAISQLERVQKKIASRRAGIAGNRPMRLAPHDAVCSFCIMTAEMNPSGEHEELVACATCDNCGHPSCLQLDNHLTETIRTYQWQCIECRKCSVCRDPHDDDKMLFCDSCDRGYHTYCVSLASLPKGRWVCHLCGVCESCGVTSPGPPGTKWRHEYNKSSDGKKTFLQTLCVGCSVLFRRGDFCPSCLVVYRTDDTDLPMICCDVCDRWVHAECDGINDEQYEEFTDEGGFYECLLCKGNQAERCDKFHRKKLEAEDAGGHTLVVGKE